MMMIIIIINVSRLPSWYDLYLGRPKILPNFRILADCSRLVLAVNGQICDMVAISMYMNVTLVIPELDKTSFWQDPR